MRRFATALGLALGLTLLLGAAADARAARVDPALVGSWLLDEPATPFNQGSRQVLEVRADGTYTLFSPAKGHAGSIEAADGTWSLAARTSTWKDGGRYEVKGGKSTLALSGVFGPSTWKRFTEPPNFATTPVGGQPIPAYVPQSVARTWVEVAIPWQQDAIPVDLEITLWERTGEFQLRTRYLSPAKRAGLVVDSFRYERRVTEQANVSWPSKAMPLGFVDLPKAIELFTQGGRPGPYKRFTFTGDHPGWGWGAVGATPGKSAIVWVTEDGRVSHEPNWAQIAEYNRAWDEALAPLRKVFGGGASGGEWVDGFWKDMCQRQWAGYGGGTWQSGTCY